MARFLFQLESVLQARKRAEREKQRQLADVAAQWAALDVELRALNETSSRATADLRNNHLVGRIDLHFLAAHRRFVIATQRKALGLMQKMAVVQKQLDDARAALREAAKQRKAFEKLREKHHARWVEVLGRREMSETDEINMQLNYWQTFEQTDGTR